MADEPNNKPKRRVRGPDTFRERAQKAAETSDKPSKVGGVRRFLGLVFSPIGNLLSPIFKWKPIRIIGKIVFPTYFRNSLRELRQVTWPNWTQSRQLTFAVLVFAVVFGAVIAIVDYGLDKIFRNILLK